MNDMQAQLGRNLLKGLVSLKTQKGNLSLEDVGDIFMKLAAGLPNGSSADAEMHEEIRRLAAYITDAKKEILAMDTTGAANGTTFTDASAHLDEVIKATEEASNTIMDAADIIQGQAGGIGGEKEQKIMDATNAIYGACNFQDITGQRITKVIKLLVNIEERITKLNSLFGTANDNDANAPIIAADGTYDEKDLLNGPQLKGQASSQADIDALFASLGGKQ